MTIYKNKRGQNVIDIPCVKCGEMRIAVQCTPEGKEQRKMSEGLCIRCARQRMNPHNFFSAEKSLVNHRPLDRRMTE